MTRRDITTAWVYLDNPLTMREIPYLRGALLHLAGEDNVLFHDHVGEELRYRYPLIQYREHNGKAMVFCLEEGVEAMKTLFMAESVPTVRIGRRREPLLFVDMEAYETPLAVIENFRTYAISKYLPLNQTNYAEYQATDRLIDRLLIIERSIVGNILSFAKSMDVFFDMQVEARLMDVTNARTYRYKNISMTGFDLTFKTNVSLPDGIALGKGVSLGFGVVRCL